jgi:hypothetical protein
MKLEFFLQIFDKITKFQISWKSVQWDTSCCVRTVGRRDGQTDRQTDRQTRRRWRSLFSILRTRLKTTQRREVHPKATCPHRDTHFNWILYQSSARTKQDYDQLEFDLSTFDPPLFMNTCLRLQCAPLGIRLMVDISAVVHLLKFIIEHLYRLCVYDEAEYIAGDFRRITWRLLVSQLTSNLIPN